MASNPSPIFDFTNPIFKQNNIFTDNKIPQIDYNQPINPLTVPNAFNSEALQNTSTYKSIKSKLSLEDQQIYSIKIIRIVKSTSLKYDVYISFKIKGEEEEYWGVVTDIMNFPDFKSEIFKDHTLLQTKEWVIKTKGLVIKNILNWLKPQFGKFKLLKDEIYCYSSKTGKLNILPKNSKIEVLKSYNDKIIFEYNNEQYTLTGDNFIYFNWWFEQVN